MWTRRRFLKALGVLGGAALIPFHRLRLLEAASLADLAPASEGELYAGFVLLPEGAPVPPMVKRPRLGVPIVCGVGVGRGGTEPNAVTRSYSDAAELAKDVSFPVYTLGQLPERIRPAGAYVLKYNSGEPFGASVNFEALNASTGKWEGTVRIWAQPDFSRPFPLWSSEPAGEGEPSVVLEKEDILPSPGIRVATQAGYVFHWIKDDVFYTATADHRPSGREAQALVASLVPIQ